MQQMLSSDKESQEKANSANKNLFSRFDPPIYAHISNSCEM